MIQLKRTNSDDKDFISLVKKLDADLAIRDGEDFSFYAQYNKLNSIKHTIVAYKNNVPIGCGAIKKFEEDTMEVKRMFVDPKLRGNGIASKLVRELEVWAKELAYKKCILETGYNQPEAIALYKKNGYEVIPNYGQYEDVENSVCFEKNL